MSLSYLHCPHTHYSAITIRLSSNYCAVFMNDKGCGASQVWIFICFLNDL